LDTQTTCASPGATTNTANCDSVVGDLTDVGDYTGAASPYQTFDQGGNVWEWNEAIISGSNRGLRGGAFIFFASDLAASVRSSLNAVLEVEDVGFRVASPVPPPPVPALGTIGLLCVAAGLFGFGAYYRRRA
jgi:formylglycine-generating enzyme required for sulfatase activity